MSIFGSIVHRIVQVAGEVLGDGAPDGIGAQTVTAADAGSGDAAALDPGAVQVAGADGAAIATVDVGATLSALANRHGGGGNWQSSIVDLLKLLDLDSSMAARHALAEELGVHAGADGTAEQNMALHKAVMDRIAANGGKVPATMS